MTSPTVISATSSTSTRLSPFPLTTTLNRLPRTSLTPRHAPFQLRCNVAVKSDSSTSISDAEDAEVKSKLEKVGSKIRVKSPMKVYHVPRVAEVELTPEMEGVVKQYVGFSKGKRITANYPFKIEFFTEVEGRGKVKFFAHLKEDEFDFVE